MNRFHTKIKLLPIVFLFSIFIPFLILPFFSITPFNPSFNSSEEQAQTKDYDANPVSPPSPSGINHTNDIFPIEASADDATNRQSRSTPSVNYISKDLVLGGVISVLGNRHICLRFNVSIPQNSSIYNAYLNLTAYSGLVANWYYIYAFDDNATSDFSDVAEDIYNTRPRTSINVSWWIDADIGKNTTLQTPNMSSILQYLVNLDNWTNKSHVGIYIEAGLDAYNELFFQSYNFGNLSLTPKLVIDYEDEVGRQLKVFNITQSQDDATYNPPEPYTDYTSHILTLGGHSYYGNAKQKRICLRFTVSLPKYAIIHNAYLNLTSDETTSNPGSYTIRIFLIEDSATPDFSDTGENVYVLRTLNGHTDSSVSDMVQNQTIQKDVKDLVQVMVDDPNWENNSIMGFIIVPLVTSGWNNRYFNFWSFDSPDPNYFPKLIVDWEETPLITSKPADQTINNNTLGYHIEWTAVDDNPTIYTIECNYTGSFEPVQSDTWQSGVEIRYDIPKLDIGVSDYIIVNYTINVTDADGKFVWDSVLINVTDLIPLGLPVFSDVRLLQGDANFTYDERDYFICGDGPFTFQMFNSTLVNNNNIEIELSAYCPDIEFVIGLAQVTPLYFDPYSFSDWYDMTQFPYVYIPPLKYSLNYDAVSGSFNFMPSSSTRYSWGAFNKGLTGGPPPGATLAVVNKTVNSISYNVLNFLNITVDGGTDFIVGDTVYQAYLIEILNKDIHPPKYGNPKFIEPDENEPDKHYEIDILIWDEEYGSGVDEVLLYYMVDNDGKWREVSMILSQGLYSADIPPQAEEGVALDYYIVIIDVAGNSITTKVYSEKTVDFEANPVIILLLILILAMVGAISTVLIYKLWRRIFSKKYKMETKMEPKKKISRDKGGLKK